MVNFNTTILAGITLATSVCATQLHVSEGCVVVGGTSVCGKSDVIITGDTITIFAGFDSSDTTNVNARPGCRLDATWPAGTTEVFLGDDNCLFDAQGYSINGLCCNPGTGGAGLMPNPYYEA